MARTSLISTSAGLNVWPSIVHEEEMCLALCASSRLRIALSVLMASWILPASMLA